MKMRLFVSSVVVQFLVLKHFQMVNHPTFHTTLQFHPPPTIVNTISQRIQTNGIIWIVIGAIQILLGISVNWVLLIVGVLNLVSSIQDINYSKSFPLNPVGIVNKVKPLTGPIITLIYNLVIGGIIGVAGSIYYFIAVRGFVLENEQAFLEIENLQSDNL